MINTHNNDNKDWTDNIKIAKKNILEKLSRVLKRDIESLIEVEDVLYPQQIEMETSSFKGSLYGNSSNSRNEAFFRQSNFHSKVKGLYFCGGSVHPGGGIPLCMLSAKITSELIRSKEK
jgi:phytoene dehydrogenase-like protein